MCDVNVFRTADTQDRLFLHDTNRFKSIKRFIYLFIYLSVYKETRKPHFNSHTVFIIKLVKVFLIH